MPTWPPEVRPLTAEGLATAVAGAPLVGIHGWARWNGYDYKFASQLTQMAENSSTPLQLYAMDIEEPSNGELMADWGVWNVPAFIVFREGKRVTTFWMQQESLDQFRERIEHWLRTIGMSWSEKLLSLYVDAGPERGFRLRQELRPPASPEMLADLEQKLAARLPGSLRSLLLETNGVMGMMSVDEGAWFEQGWTVWPAEQIAEQNAWHRRNFPGRKVERFVFFSGAGADGILFGFPSATEPADDAAVYAWYPDETEAKLLATGLEEFLTGWCSGRIAV